MILTTKEGNILTKYKKKMQNVAKILKWIIIWILKMTKKYIRVYNLWSGGIPWSTLLS